MTAMIATASPSAVEISASEIPAATTEKPPVPIIAIDWNAARMPTTVPKRPMKGAEAPEVASTQMGPRNSINSAKRRSSSIPSRRVRSAACASLINSRKTRSSGLRFTGRWARASSNLPRRIGSTSASARRDAFDDDGDANDGNDEQGVSGIPALHDHVDDSELTLHRPVLVRWWDSGGAL